MYFNIGDRVIFDNLNEDIPENPGVVYEDMEGMLGKEYIIADVDIDQGRWVKLKGDPRNYVYAREWFRKVGTKKPRIRTKGFNTLVKEARRTLKEEAYADSVASYAVIGEGRVAYHSNDICHARLNKGVGKIVGALDIHNKWKECIPKENHSAYKEAIKYVISESVWKNAFLSNNHVNFLKHGVLINVEEKTSYVVQAVQALRMPKERRARLPVFKLLKRAGVSSDVAFLMMLCYSPIPSKKGQFSQSIPCSHSPINSAINLEFYLKFLAGKEKPFSKEKAFNEGREWNITPKFYKGGDDLRRALRSIEEKPSVKKNIRTYGEGWNKYTSLTTKAIIEIGRHLDNLLEGFKK